MKQKTKKLHRFPKVQQSPATVPQERYFDTCTTKFCLAQVMLCSACSGHGYKFASVVGEILADLATSGTTQHDIALHRIREDRKGMDGFLSRFARSPKARL